MIEWAGLEAVGLNAGLPVLLRFIEHQVISLSACIPQILLRVEQMLKLVVGFVTALTIFTIIASNTRDFIVDETLT